MSGGKKRKGRRIKNCPAQAGKVESTAVRLAPFFVAKRPGKREKRRKGTRKRGIIARETAEIRAFQMICTSIDLSVHLPFLKKRREEREGSEDGARAVRNKSDGTACRN